ASGAGDGDECADGFELHASSKYTDSVWLSYDPMQWSNSHRGRKLLSMPLSRARHPVEPRLRRRRVATVAGLLGLVVAAFEGTVVTTAMPTIARELGGLALYPWVFSAFLVASMLGVLVCGKLADVYGRRPVYAGGMALFLLGSALCGSANTLG